MTEEVLPEGPLEEGSVHFQSAGNTTLRAVAICLVLVMASLWLLLSDGPLGEKAFGVLGSVFFGSVTVIHLFNLARGKKLGGLWVDGDGIVDRTSYSPMGRVYWHEIKAIYPINPSFFGIPLPRQGIGLDVRDSYILRRSARIRFKVWLNKKVFRAPDIQLSSGKLRNSRTQVLFVLQRGLRQYELRSISEGKELDPGG